MVRQGAPDELDGFGADPSLARALRPFADALYERYWRVSVEGAEGLPKGPCVLVANHGGALPLDGPVLRLALRRARPNLPTARWLLEDAVFHTPVVGSLASRLGAVKATPENAAAVLAEGRPLIVFPEGLRGLSKPYAERYRLQRFGRGGYVKIAASAGLPIVPVGVVGGEEAMPLLAKLPAEPLGLPYMPLTTLPLPTKWCVRFGTPIMPGAFELEADGAASLNELIRDTIAAMLSSMLEEREGVFFGTS